MKVSELLAAARDLLNDPVEDTLGWWPHGAAVLTRQAIEATMAVWWDRTVPEMQQANWTEKWLALPAYLGRDPLIPAAHYTWTALSQACHHRAYDIGLTEPELRGHLETARNFAVLVADKLDEKAASAGG